MEIEWIEKKKAGRPFLDCAIKFTIKTYSNNKNKIKKTKITFSKKFMEKFDFKIGDFVKVGFFEDEIIAFCKSNCCDAWKIQPAGTNSADRKSILNNTHSTGTIEISGHVVKKDCQIYLENIDVSKNGVLLCNLIK